MVVLGLIAIPVLILINGYFVAVEFALVAVRKTRVEELVQQGARGARSVRNAIDNLNRSIAAAQLGITLASIALGAVGESVLARLLESQLTFVPEHLQWVTRHSIATLLSIAIITYLHVILGEQVPKMMAIQSADAIALWSAPPLNGFARVTSPVLKLMNATGNAVLRLMGYKSGEGHEQVHSVEELKMLVEDTEEAGLLEEHQAQFVKNVFQLTDKTVGDCMVPKEKMDALEIHTKLDRILEVVRRSGHTRLPVYEETVDNIVGILNSKHLFSIITQRLPVILEDVLYPATFIDPESPVSVAIQLFRKSRRPMAIVRGKDKKVLGMLTLEDVLEEIVGDIQDEHDEGGPRALQPPGP
ncbi:MAG TPA: hemolysin family protein [Gemmataceae bacterium]|nr:hemolysin family protein [Gemmataceae bacterium]